MGSVMRSVMSVTFSSGWMRKHVKTAERAPGMNSAGKGCDSRCDAVAVRLAMGLLRCKVPVQGRHITICRTENRFIYIRVAKQMPSSRQTCAADGLIWIGRTFLR